MKFSLIIGDEHENEVIVYAREESSTVKAIRAICEGERDIFVGYSGESVYKISPYEVFCFVSEGDLLFAETEKGRLRIKSRLSHIEEMLPYSFIRNKSVMYCKYSHDRKIRRVLFGYARSCF